jgi:hypothetical protein
MTRSPIFSVVLGTALLGGLLAQPLQAQNGQRLREWRERQVAQRNGGFGRGQNQRGAVGLPPKWVENLREMSPEAQDRFLANNDRFQSLPPARQAQIRQNLRKWNQLTPEQKNRIRATEGMLEQLSPEQREHFRDEIVPKLAQLPPERRMRVLNHWRRLQLMTPEEQQATLRDPRFMPGLSPDEQSLVRDLNSLGVPPPQTPPHDAVAPER